MPVADAVVHLRLLLRFLEKRHDAVAEFAEERVERILGEPLLKLVEAVVVWIHIRVDVPGESLIRRKDLLQDRTEHLKVRSFLRLVPDVVRLHEQFLISDVLVHRDLLHLADVLQQQIDHPLFLLIEFLFMGIQVFQQCHRFFRGAQTVHFLRQDRKSDAAVLRRLLRCPGRAVVVNQADGVLIGSHLALQCHQFLFCAFHGPFFHVAVPFRL